MPGNRPPRIKAMTFHVTDTDTGLREAIEAPGDAGLDTAELMIVSLFLRVTVTHTKGKLSHFAIHHQRFGDFDYELFNNDPLVAGYHLANMLRRFSMLRYARWINAKLKEMEP